ncbi:unnamed protein product [Auanema sp. JU1783]|nr:unnamed protein product [Auanema sp. JU1783]
MSEVEIPFAEKEQSLTENNTEFVKDKSIDKEEQAKLEESPKINGENGLKLEKKEDEDWKPITPGPNQLDDYDIDRDSRNRVKLYVLCEQRVWDDRGTGHVACVPLPGQQQAFVIIVKLETTERNVLESKILMDTVYQKQQETLIVWSESETCDLALSFQEKSGCEEIWAKICEVQGRDPGDPEGGFDELDEGELSEGSSSGRVTLPPIEMGRLGEIDYIISTHMSSVTLRDKMCKVLESEGVMPKLAEVFKMCEDLENTDGLHSLYTIAKNIILMHRNGQQDLNFMEYVFDDRYMKEVIGMLEYDPAYDEPRKHREFLYEQAKFREVLRISDPDVITKIHKAYRIQYLQEVCIPAPSLFEENLTGTLNSYAFFLRVEISSSLQKDKKFMKDLFDELKSPKTGMNRRRDCVHFLREFLHLTNVQPGQPASHQKDTVAKNVIQAFFNADILSTVEPCMRSSDPMTRAFMVDIMSTLVDCNSSLVRDFIVKQAKGKENDDLIINLFIVHMLSDSDLELTSATHVSNILRSLLDPENMPNISKSDKSDFLNVFYQRSIYSLLKPMVENVKGGVIKNDDYCTANKEALIVKLLCFCIEHHSFSMRMHCISNDLLNKVLILLSSRHHFLSLCALKMIRAVLTVKDEFYNRYIVREKVLDKVVDCYVKNGSRYNLLNSALLDLFDYIRNEDIKILVKYIVENHMATFETISYVKVFTDLRLKYEQQKDREASGGRIPVKEDRMGNSPTFNREERWFEEDDDEDASSDARKEIRKENDSPRKTGSEPMFPSVLRRKNAIEDDEGPVFSGLQNPVHSLDKKIIIKVGDKSRTPSPSTSPAPSPSREDEVTSSQNNSKENSPVNSIRSLVDYGDSDSDEDEDQIPGPSTPSDSMPSSSTGSPASMQDEILDESAVPNGPLTEDSVSSTSNDNEETVIRRSKRPSSDAFEEESGKRSRVK